MSVSRPNVQLNGTVRTADCRVVIGCAYPRSLSVRNEVMINKTFSAQLGKEDICQTLRLKEM